MSNISSLLEKLNNYYSFKRRTTLNRMRENPDPFKILIGCLVSINIRDEVCEEILENLFNKVRNFQDIVEINILELETILYKARYRKIKARTLKSVSKEILERFNGVVPDEKENLLSIKGIGPKTCNVVLNFAFNKRVIPIDSNTLRIANRIGWISTKKNEDVEKLLLDNLNEEMIKNANAIFMLHGKEVCVPVSPFCTKCPIEKNCMKIGVDKRR